MDNKVDQISILFWETLALLVAAILFVTLLKRFGLSSVLGYIAAGLVIGPVMRLVSGGEELLHFAEFGVTLLLFVIGLELQPSRLWAMRTDIFGLGLSQVVLTGAVLSGLAAFGFGDWRAALVIGYGLALSSTALVMQELDQSGQTSHPHGRKAFSILLFQDLAIVPLLLMVSLLAPGGENVTLADGLQRLAVALAAIALLVATGRYLLNPMFRILAATNLNEIMTAAALAIVIGAAGLMSLAGMSYAMGAFIAGVMLAESNFRHELEADIEPFRGLFLGLFFMAVGMTIKLQTIELYWWFILLATPAVMAAKTILIYALMRLFRNDGPLSWKTALTLPQYGEFGFVLFTAAASLGVFGQTTASVLLAMVTLSMVLSPFVTKLSPLVASEGPREEMEADFSGANGQVLVIGFGRFGQIVSQGLLACDYRITVIDSDQDRVIEAQRFGFEIYYGDGTRQQILRAARTAQASVVCVCVDDPDISLRIVDLLQREYPQAVLLVRAYDRSHSIGLRRRDVAFEIRETVESALVVSGRALQALGMTEEEAAEVIADVRHRDERRLQMQVEGDLLSGRDMLHGVVVKPEPLSAPARTARLRGGRKGKKTTAKKISVRHG